MSIRACCYRAVFTVLCALAVLAASPVSSVSGEESVDANVETAGEWAQFASAFCKVSPRRVGQYKARLRKKLTDAHDFDRHWQEGWNRAERRNLEMSALRERDPTEFAARTKVNCQRVRWMADKSVQPRQQK